MPNDQKQTTQGQKLDVDPQVLAQAKTQGQRLQQAGVPAQQQGSRQDLGSAARPSTPGHYGTDQKWERTHVKGVQTTPESSQSSSVAKQQPTTQPQASAAEKYGQSQPSQANVQASQQTRATAAEKYGAAHNTATPQQPQAQQPKPSP